MDPGRPQPGEYAAYFERYISKVPDRPVIPYLDSQIEKDLSWLNSISVDKLNYRYAEGKWTIPQIMVHTIDTERIMSYRALVFARGEQQQQPGFDQDAYALHWSGLGRSFREILEEYQAVRESSLALFRSFKSMETWMSRGVASGNEVSVRALAFIIAGHHVHHMGVIKELYLS